MPRKYTTKCTYEQVKKAILEFGAYKAPVARALRIDISTLNQYLKNWPKLNKLFMKTRKMAPYVVRDNLLSLLTSDTTSYLNPVMKAYILRLLGNAFPEEWAASQKKVTNNTINNVSVQNKEITITDDRKSEILNRLKTSHPELIDKAAMQLGLKELNNPGEVIENVPLLEEGKGDGDEQRTDSNSIELVQEPAHDSGQDGGDSTGEGTGVIQ